MTAVGLAGGKVENGLDSNWIGILGWFGLGRNGLKSLLGWLDLGSHFSSPSHELVSPVTSRASSSAAAAAAYAYAKQSAGPLSAGAWTTSSFPSTTTSRSTCSSSSTGKEGKDEGF